MAEGFRCYCWGVDPTKVTKCDFCGGNPNMSIEEDEALLQKSGLPLSGLAVSQNPDEVGLPLSRNMVEVGLPLSGNHPENLANQLTAKPLTAKPKSENMAEVCLPVSGLPLSGAPEGNVENLAKQLGSRGGKKRATSLTSKRRSEIARMGYEAQRKKISKVTAEQEEREFELAYRWFAANMTED